MLRTFQGVTTISTWLLANTNLAWLVRCHVRVWVRLLVLRCGLCSFKYATPSVKIAACLEVVADRVNIILTRIYHELDVRNRNEVASRYGSWTDLR